MAGIAIIGAGQAGLQLALSLRDEGYGGPVMLFDRERGLPYQRPPLSKEFLRAKMLRSQIAFRPREYFAARRIELHDGIGIAAIDARGRRIVTCDGRAIGYDHLVLATGSRNRRLAGVDKRRRNVFQIRTAAESAAVRGRLRNCRSAIVVGGGFLGLEFASVARAMGVEVVVLEAAARLMSRSLSAETSGALLAYHAEDGVEIRLSTGVAALAGNRQATALTTTDGDEIAADIVVCNIGAEPHVEIAAAAGLEIANGIVVDERLATADPAISAIGDCASFPCSHAGERRRYESVQNATDQARFLARRLTGRGGNYDSLPWFWSEQCGARLQIAGVGHGDDTVVLSGDPQARKFSALAFRDGVLACVESVNSPADHFTARRILSGRSRIPFEAARAAGFQLRGLAETIPGQAR